MRVLNPNRSKNLQFRNPGTLIFELGISHFSFSTSIFPSSASPSVSPWRPTLPATLSPVPWEVLILCWLAAVECLTWPGHLEDVGPLATWLDQGWAYVSLANWAQSETPWGWAWAGPKRHLFPWACTWKGVMLERPGPSSEAWEWSPAVGEDAEAQRGTESWGSSFSSRIQLCLRPEIYSWQD